MTPYHRRYGLELVLLDGKYHYEPVPEEQAVIRRICAGRADGIGYYRMADLLTEEGVPTVTGNRWRASVLRRIALRGPDS